MRDARVGWVVSVLNVTPELGDEEPVHYGPWSRETAENLVLDLERRFDALSYGDEFSVTRWPLRRLSAAQIVKERTS